VRTVWALRQLFDGDDHGRAVVYAAYSCACVRLKRVVDAASRSSKAPSKHPGAGLPLLAASSSLAIRAIARTNGLGKLGELGQPGSWGESWQSVPTMTRRPSSLEAKSMTRREKPYRQHKRTCLPTRRAGESSYFETAGVITHRLLLHFAALAHGSPLPPRRPLYA